MAQVGLFGMWDRFHPGHKKALTVAFNNANSVLIAIIDGSQNNTGDKWDIQSLQTRKDNVRDYIIANGWGSKVEKTVEYVDLLDMVNNAHLENFDNLILPKKDQGRLCTADHLSSIADNFRDAGKTVPNLIWIENQTVGQTDYPWSSSKLRRIIQRYYQVGRIHPVIHGLIKDYMPWAEKQDWTV